MPNTPLTPSDIPIIYAGQQPPSPYRVVDLHGHIYHWISDVMWSASVSRGGGTPLAAGRTFDSLEEALDWIQDKPHFHLEKIQIIRAQKVSHDHSPKAD